MSISDRERAYCKLLDTLGFGNSDDFSLFEKAMRHTSYVHEVDIPIECYYVGFDSSVVIVFSEDIGTVDISIVNTSTGEVFFDTVDAKDGQYAVGISGDDGTYILQIGTESGDIYEGEFTLN